MKSAWPSSMALQYKLMTSRSYILLAVHGNNGAGPVFTGESILLLTAGKRYMR